MKQLNSVKLLMFELGLRSGVANLWGVGGWVGRVPRTLKERCIQRRRRIHKDEREKKSAYLFSLTFD